MAKKKTPTKLGHLQIAVLKSLWARKTASVNEVHADLFDSLQLAPTTIATVLRRMELRGMVAHLEQGRQFIYRPLISENEVAESAAEEVLDRLFEGRLAAMVSHLISRRPIDSQELERLAQLIATKRQDRKSQGKE